jgi:GDSL-like lipase/acylhydrolase family protein/SGNH-like hydrolase/esterase family protein
MRSTINYFLLGLLIDCGAAAMPRLAAAQVAGGAKSEQPKVRWIRFPEEREASQIQIHGLPWFDDRIGDFGRLPLDAKDAVPPAVWNRSREPSGGRIRFRSNTTRLAMRLKGEGKLTQRSTMSDQGSRGLDVYVDGAYWKSIIVGQLAEHERLVFRDVGRQPREFTIYLPVGQELKVTAIGIDPAAMISAPPVFAQSKPIVFYGSSVAQGSGVTRPGMTYEAVLGRKLNVDFVNLGFGGAGKAEPAVVELVASIDACCYVFDLGRSYGDQDKMPYKNMLAAVRARHPHVPLVCVLPIYNPIEHHDQSWIARTQHTRKVFREAFSDLKPIDKNLHLVGEYDLMKPTEGDGSSEGVHPSDLGYSIMAERLAAILKPRLP